MSESVISSTMFICDVLIAMVTWSGFGSSSASMWRVSSDSHFASPSSPSGENEIDPPTCRIISGTASRSRRSSSLNCDSRLEPLPSSSRTWMCSTVAPASQQSTACCTCWSMVSGMSSGKSPVAPSGPYGAAVMTSFSWFSGNRESSRKGMVLLLSERGSEGFGADDSRTFHLADAGPVVLNCVVLRGTVVPDREAVLRPAPAHLVLGHGRLPDQVVQQFTCARGVVEPETHVLRRVEVGEVRGERVDEEDHLARLRVRPHDRVLGVGVALVQGQPLLGSHGRTEAGLDAVPRPEAGDLLLHVLGQATVGLRHVDPDRVAADRGRLDAAEHRAHRRDLPPGRVAVVRVLVVLGLAVEVLVDRAQPGVVRIAAGNRVVLEAPEPLGQRDVLAAADVLVAEEQDLVLEQQVVELGEEAGVPRGLGQADVAQLGADGRGLRDDLDRAGADAQGRQHLSLRRPGGNGGHGCSPVRWGFGGRTAGGGSDGSGDGGLQGENGGADAAAG